MLKKGRAKEKGRVSEWQAKFGLPRPKVAALFGLATGGSHFVLHKMHGHPQILALKQRALYPELKHYFGEGNYPIDKLLVQQLRPRKESPASVKWIVVNKPQMAFISNQFLFNRERIANFYCFRNPMALFHSRASDRTGFGRKIYGHEPSWEEIAASIVDEYRVSLAAFAQVYSPEKDFVLNLESFAAQLDEHLSAIWDFLGVDHVDDGSLAVLESCELCGRKLIAKEGEVGSRIEDVLYCAYDDLFYTGPGGYNYIRKFNIENVASWKKKAHAEGLLDYFSKELGTELVHFFEGEEYLSSGSLQAFRNIFEATLGGFRGLPT